MLIIAAAVKICGDVILPQTKIFRNGEILWIKNSARQGHPRKGTAKTERFGIIAWVGKE